jgi:hypothetical protein
MAFSAVTARGSAVSNTNGTTLSRSPTANITVGKIAFAVCGSDNDATTDSDTTFHAVTDSVGNTWARLKERTETDGAAGDGVVASIWWTKVGTQIGTGDSVTLTLGVAETDKVIVLFEATVGAGKTIALEQAVAANGAISATVAGMTSREYLLIGWGVSEGEDSAKTPDADYSELYDGITSTTGVLDVNIAGHLQTRIATLTGDTVTSTAWTFTNAVTILAAVYEVNEPIILACDVQSYTLTGNASTFNRTMVAATGTFNDTFVDATFNKGLIMAADVANFAVNGFSQVGSALTLSNISLPYITALNSTEIAFVDAAFDQIRRYSFNGSTWSLLSGSLTIAGNIGGTAIVALSPTRIVLIDGEQEWIRTYDWNGSSWAQVGNSLTIAFLGFGSISKLSSNRIANYDSNLARFATYEFDGTDWTNIGSNLFVGDYLKTSSTPIGENLIAWASTTHLRTYSFAGGVWAQVGNSLSLTSSNPEIITIAPNKVIFIDATNDEFRVYVFDGTNWSQTGEKLPYAVQNRSEITMLTESTFAYVTDGNLTDGSLRTFRFGASATFTKGAAPAPNTKGQFFQFF